MLIRSILPICCSALLNFDSFIIIIMEVCKAPILRLKALNKRTHIDVHRDENVIKKEKKKKISTRVQT